MWEIQNWLSLVSGIIFLPMGILFIKYRVVVADFNASLQRATGTKFGREAAKRGATPFWMAVVGVFFTCIGIGALAMAVFRHTWS
jgi:hypothetical protein